MTGDIPSVASTIEEPAELAVHSNTCPFPRLVYRRVAMRMPTLETTKGTR